MINEELSLFLGEEIADQTYYEGMLIHPTQQQHGIVVLRRNDDNQTLELYQIKLYPPLEYRIEQRLLTRTFPSEKKVQIFLETFSQLTGNEFWRFIEACESKK
ncbi:hypothetical protein Pryu01_00805 [Paraliobacillus ryukyuensis]|uniref:Uncharacterized protein n=1 Tax=Paraliobacillus ryukyuensis TaxID=200904 RepID=A0A366EE08_9BACI|nr:hypothetical protein [Paraliobacillus ryukyuensis]RBP00622.1 hypothetical protein DES48_102387 [Paraliobacillus ryukyuensis]